MIILYTQVCTVYTINSELDIQYFIKDKIIKNKNYIFTYFYSVGNINGLIFRGSKFTVVTENPALYVHAL